LSSVFPARLVLSIVSLFWVVVGNKGNSENSCCCFGTGVSTLSAIQRPNQSIDGHDIKMAIKIMLYVVCVIILRPRVGVCYLCISASSQPTVHKLVIKATLDTSGGRGIFHSKIGESLLRLDHSTSHFGHLSKPLWQVNVKKLQCGMTD
jgi:hypothetical protein